MWGLCMQAWVASGMVTLMRSVRETVVCVRAWQCCLCSLLTFPLAVVTNMICGMRAGGGLCGPGRRHAGVLQGRPEAGAGAAREAPAPPPPARGVPLLQLHQHALTQQRVPAQLAQRGAPRDVGHALGGGRVALSAAPDAACELMRRVLRHAAGAAYGFSPSSTRAPSMREGAWPWAARGWACESRDPCSTLCDCDVAVLTYARSQCRRGYYALRAYFC